MSIADWNCKVCGALNGRLSDVCEACLTADGISEETIQDRKLFFKAGHDDSPLEPNTNLHLRRRLAIGVGLPFALCSIMLGTYALVRIAFSEGLQSANLIVWAVTWLSIFALIAMILYGIWHVALRRVHYVFTRGGLILRGKRDRLIPWRCISSIERISKKKHPNETYLRLWISKNRPLRDSHPDLEPATWPEKVDIDLYVASQHPKVIEKYLVDATRKFFRTVIDE